MAWVPAWWSAIRKSSQRDFPGGSVANTLPSTAGDMGSTPGQGTKIPQAAWQGQKTLTFYYSLGEKENGKHVFGA